eukprot:189408-Hanusia_phi.AAC.1
MLARRAKVKRDECQKRRKWRGEKGGKEVGKESGRTRGGERNGGEDRRLTVLLLLRIQQSVKQFFRNSSPKLTADVFIHPAIPVSVRVDASQLQPCLSATLFICFLFALRSKISGTSLEKHREACGEVTNTTDQSHSHSHGTQQRDA